MDDKRFDPITHALGGVSGRRQAVKSIFGGAVATGLGALGLAEADAKNKGKGKGKKGGKGKRKHANAQRAGDCPPATKISICHNARHNGVVICVDKSGCNGHGHHDDDCVCSDTSFNCGSGEGTLKACASCNLDTGDCSSSCIVKGVGCTTEAPCCDGLTCNNGTCEPACKNNDDCGDGNVCCSGTCHAGDCCENSDCDDPGICQVGKGTCSNFTCTYDDKTDGSRCTPPAGAANRKRKGKGKRAHASSEPAGVCCGGDCFVGDCCSNDDCNKGETCSNHQCTPSCQSKDQSCSAEQPCCEGLACDPSTSTCQPVCSDQNPCDNGRICCDGVCYAGECCVDKDCDDGTTCQVNPGTCSKDHTCSYDNEPNGTFCGEKSGSARKRKGTQPASGPVSPVCCDGDCVECCTSEDCEGGEVCNDQHHCVPSCQTQGETCDAQNPCCEGLTCDPTSGTCVATCTEGSCGQGKICCGGVCIDESHCCAEDKPGCNDGDVCCSGTCYTGVCCDNDGCTVSTESRKRKGNGANPSGLASDVCCDHQCVECCTSGDCPEHEICNDQHQCVSGCGTGPACTGDQVCCGDGESASCVDLGTNDNCLVCGDTCDANETCCADSGGCVDLNDSNNNNCGTCGNICPGGTTCEGGNCTTPCGQAGDDCLQQACCAPFVCGGENGHTCVECTPDGDDCSLAECCSADFTCKKQGKKHRCVKAGGGGGGGGGNGSGCFHVGGKPVPGKPCCPRLHEEHGRCVINRWDHCDQSNRGQRSWCEHGTTCEGGRISPHHQEVCVPKGYRRRQRRRRREGLGATAETTPVTTPPTTPVS